MLVEVFHIFRTTAFVMVHVMLLCCIRENPFLKATIVTLHDEGTHRVYVMCFLVTRHTSFVLLSCAASRRRLTVDKSAADATNCTHTGLLTVALSLNSEYQAWKLKLEKFKPPLLKYLV